MSLRIIAAAQRDVLDALLVHDAIDDRARGGSGWEGSALLSRAQRRLAALFPPRHAFWRDWDKLLREQCAAQRGSAARRGLLQRLGSKAAMARMPAFAVARAAGRRPHDAPFARLFVIHQILDDLLDADQDAKRGQVNAANLLGMGPACAACRRELETLLAETPPASGLARHARRLRAALDRMERLRYLRGVDDVLTRLLA